MKNQFRRQYRIVTDEYLGFEVQCREWWWPFWSQPYTNTHSTLEAAKKFAIQHSRRVVANVI